MVGEFVRGLDEESKAGTFVSPLSEQEEQISTLRLVESKISEYASQAVKPFKQVAKHYEEERLGGRALVAKGISAEPQSVWERAKNIGLGTMQYTMSPLTAVAKGAVGASIQEAAEATPLKNINLPLGLGTAAQFLGKLGEEATYFVPIGGTIKQIMMRSAPEGLRALEKTPSLIPKAKEVVYEGKGEDIHSIIDNTLLPISKVEGDLAELTQPILKEGIAKKITEGAVPAIQKGGGLKNDERIFKQIAEKLAEGEISIPALKEIQIKRGLTDLQVAKIFKESASFWGRNLQYLSRARKELEGVYKDHPDVLKAIDETIAKTEGGMVDKALDYYGRVENFRRAMMVTQIATAIRNSVSQLGRVTVGALDNSLQGFVRGTVGAEGNTYEQVKSGLNTFTAFWGRVSPKARARLDEILDTEGAAISKARLFSQPVHEVTLGKIANVFNTLNRTQEYFYRNLAFEAKTRELLARRKLNYNTIDPREIPEGIFEEATNYALEMTFSAMPESKGLKGLINAWTKIPGLTTINPFPRFNFGNALPFMWEHSPLGYLNAVSPSVLKDLANGNPQRFAKAASRATLGTLMLDQGIQFRNSDHAGEKWYEIKKGDKRIDMRAYAPFSTFLFIGEALTHPNNLKAADYVEGLIGLNRIAGTGLVALDWIRSRNGEELEKKLSNFAGQYISSFTTPSRTLSDLFSGINPKEGIFRDYRESPFIAPTLLNLPKLSQIVPEKPSPIETGTQYKAEPIRIGEREISGSFAKQLSGLSSKKKSALEKEIDILQIPWNRIAPKSGIPEADRKLSRYMAPIVEQLAPMLMKTKDYEVMKPEMRRLALGEIFKFARQKAGKQLAIDNPELALQVMIRGKGEDMEKIIGSILKGRKVRD